MKLELQSWKDRHPALTGTLTGSAEETPQEKRLRKLHELQQTLKSMRTQNNPRETAKQQAIARAELLKQRIEMLKSQLLCASPEQAKAIARQIGAIAKELSSLGHLLGGNSGGGSSGATGRNASASAEGGDASGISPATDTAPATTEPATETASAGTEAAAEAPANASDVAQSAPQKAAEDQPSAGQNNAQTEADDSNRANNASKGDSASNTDQSLRASLQDAAKRLKELIELLKIKLRAGEREAKEELQQAERDLQQLDSHLSGGSNLYSALASSAGLTQTGASVGIAASAALGSSVGTAAPTISVAA